MKSTISGYDDAVNGLDKLTKGNYSERRSSRGSIFKGKFRFRREILGIL